MTNSTALTTIDHPGATSVALFNADRLEQMFRLADIMASSSLLPQHLTHKGSQQLAPDAVRANALMVVDLALGMQVSPFLVAQHVSLVHGKLCVEGKLVAAMLEARLGVRLHYAISGTGPKMQISVTGTLPGENEPRPPIVGTVEEWRTSGTNSPWSSPSAWPRMLRYRGAREWARAYAPSILLGIYTPDEIEGDEAPPRNITPPAPPPRIPDAPALPPAQPAPSIQDAQSVDVDPRTDTEYLVALEGELAVCDSADAIREVIEGTADEVARRGLEQRVADMADKHRGRVTKAAARPPVPPPPPKPAAYAADEERLVAVLRALDGATTYDELIAVWKEQAAAIKALTDAHKADVEAHKDRLKAKLFQGAGK